jgi:hypothetical protein
MGIITAIPTAVGAAAITASTAAIPTAVITSAITRP